MSSNATDVAATRPPKRSILVANAGSGKTWTLANRVLAWCFDELRAGRTPRPSAMLAVTFTRKAAGEILARILTHAAQGADTSKSGAKTRKSFEAVVGVASASDYLTVLEALCSDLHRMQVGTIDGYFHRIATAMPEEVGLPPDWTMGEDREIEILRSEAAARVLADPKAADLIALLESGAPKASVVDSITALIGGRSVSVLDHYRASAIDGDAGIDRAWGWIARIPQGSDVVGPDAGAHYRRVCDEWRKLDIPRTVDKKAPKPRTKWANAHRVVLECLEAKDFRKLAEQGILEKLDRNEPFDSVAPPPEWIDAMKLIKPHLRAGLIAQVYDRMHGARTVMPLADQALAELQSERGLYTFGDVGLGVARAAQRAGSRVADPNALRRAIGSDIADLAIDEAQDTSAEQFAALRPLIEDVLGVSPSESQRSARSLSSKAPGRFLVVGDPKQSIYGWRGGTPGLIAEMERRYASALDADAPLRKSYRSSKLLMDFVNRVFANLAEDVPPLVEVDAHRQPLLTVGEFIAREGLPPDVAASAFTRALAQWRFESHESADLSLEGHIHAYAYGEPDEPDDGKPAKGRKSSKSRSSTASTPAQIGEFGDDSLTPIGDPTLDPRAVPALESLSATSNEVSKAGSNETSGATSTPVPISSAVTAAERAAKVAASLHRAHPERTIGVLVRTNRVANDVIEALRAQHVPASDEGRATLLDSPAVVGVIQILRLIDQPADRIAHFLVSRGPLAKITGLQPLEEVAQRAEEMNDEEFVRAEATRFAIEMRRRIADEGLANVLREFIDRLNDSSSTCDGDSGGTGLSTRDRGRLERMVAIAEDFAAEPPARLAGFLDAIADDEVDASSADRIRVMTVHASKGLEFDEVILASLDDAWGATPKDWASVATDPTRPPQLVGPLGNEQLRAWVPELAVLERDERRRRLLDDLSLFYVAATRARRGLHLVVSNNPGGKSPTAAKLIAAALARTVDERDTLSAAPSFGAARTQAAHDQDAPFWSVEYAGIRTPSADEVHAASAGDGSIEHAQAHQSTSRNAGEVRATNDVDAAGEVHRSDALPIHHGDNKDKPVCVEPKAHPLPLVEIVESPQGRARPPSSHDGRGLWSNDPFSDEDVPLRGVLVHECFREIRSIEDLVAATVPGPARLNELVSRAAERAAIEKGLPVPLTMQQAAEQLLVQIAQGVGRAASIAEALRAAPSDEVRNEFPFLREGLELETGGAVIAGRIDRLVLHRNGDGQVVRATILDYKTGAVGASNESLREKLVGYRAQMLSYCSAVEDLWSLPKGAAEAKLLFVDRGEVVEVTSRESEAERSGPG